MKKKMVQNTLLLLLGVISVLVAILLLEGKWAGLLSGFGAMVASLSGVRIYSEQLFKRNPELKRRHDITENDERNVQLNNAAKAKVYEFKMWPFLTFFMVLLLAETQLWIMLVYVGFYILDFFIYLWSLNRLMNEM